MSKKENIEEINEQDTISKALRRNLSPKKAVDLLKRGTNCLIKQGTEQTGREIAFRVNLALGRDPWQNRADIPLKKELKAQRKIAFPYMPLISVVVPMYNTSIKYLKELVDSVLAQTYGKFELVLVNASDIDHPEVAEFCSTLTDKRINNVRIAKNRGIAENTNHGLSEAKGDYIALLDHDDVISPNALYEIVKVINRTGAQMLYSDEIVLSGNLSELREYHYKPDFSPDTLRGCNYITHFLVFEQKLLEKSGGGENKIYDGAQDYDLILRLTENANRVAHIPKVLYHWRSHAGSTASDISAKPYALDAGENAIAAQLKRLNITGKVNQIDNAPGAYRVSYDIIGEHKISVLIPSKDHIDDLERCLDSLYNYAGYDNFEVIIIENNSVQKETFEFYENKLTSYANCKLFIYEGEFNFSAINNFGAKYARGNHLLLLNNDVEFLTFGVLREMLSYSQRTDVGAVGAKLYYPDDTIQHAGVFIGIGGTAGHSHKGLSRKTKGNMYRVATVQNLSAVTGACLMVKKLLFDTMGGLDAENFAVSYNDIDFCLKLREKGLLNIFTPFVEAYHYESKSRGLDTSGKNAERYAVEKAKFICKYKHLLDEGGDEYYNPHFTLKYENYGYK